MVVLATTSTSMVAHSIDLNPNEEFRLIDHFTAKLRHLGYRPGTMDYEFPLYILCQQHEAARHRLFQYNSKTGDIGQNAAWDNFERCGLAEAFRKIYPICRPRIDEQFVLENRSGHEAVHAFFGDYWPRMPDWMAQCVDANKDREQSELLVSAGKIAYDLRTHPEQRAQIIKLHPELEIVLRAA